MKVQSRTTGVALPEIPGGWTQKEITIGGREFRITLPGNADAFLDDPEVQAASRRDDFMPYWPYLWPAASVMAERVADAPWEAGSDVLEIGCGIGLVGLAALAAARTVTFSDYHQTAVDLALHNARQNGFTNAAGLGLDWRAPCPLRYPVVLGCDVIYETAQHEPILRLIESVLSDGGECWLGDPGRQAATAFVAMARGRRRLAVSLRDKAGRPLNEPRIGRFQLIVLQTR